MAYAAKLRNGRNRSLQSILLCTTNTNKRSVGRDASSRTPGLAQYFIQSPAAHPAGAFHPKTKPTAKAMLLAPAVGFTIYICI